MTSGFDWHRLLIGEAPWSFLLEVMLRIALVYLTLVIVVRLFGKRLSGHIGNLELAVVLVLGAIVGAALQDPARGVIPAVALLVGLLILQRSLSGIGARHPTFEKVIQNGASLLIADGVIDLAELRSANIPVGQLFATLRSQGLRHLGQTRRVYLEAYGCFSVLRQSPPRSGLSISPSWDTGGPQQVEKVEGLLACSSCGTVRSVSEVTDNSPSCPNCQTRAWVTAVQEPQTAVASS